MDRDLTPALTLIKHFEGYFDKAYQDTGGVWTIGWGTISYPNGTAVKQGDVCNANQATSWLQFDLDDAIRAIDHLVKVPISNNSFCALLSFAYNVGDEALATSTLLRRLNTGENINEVAHEFGKWIHDNGRVIAGLVNRRNAEAQLFVT